MHAVDGSPLDLNLLATLHALLEEGAVTRAARRLGIGQPAASHALSRLRELFGDPLFVRSGRDLVPTPRAEKLREPLARVLAEVGRLVRDDASFAPAQTTRTFVLVCPDLLAPALPRLMARLAREAPRARLEMMLPRSADDRALEEGRADVVLAPNQERGAGLVRRGLGTLRFAVVARTDHPGRGGRRLSRRTWTEYAHVVVRTGHGGRSIVGSELTKSGIERRVGLVVPTFMTALVAVAETDLFFTAPRELVAPLCERFGLRLFEPPVPIPPVAVSAVWHERYHADPGARFFRDLVVAEVEAILGRERTRSD